MKVCTKCSKSLPATTEYFSRHKKAKDGLNWHCKACQTAKRLANLDKYLAGERASHAKNREKRNAYSRDRWNNPIFREKSLKQSREWYRDHADSRIAASKQWRADNPERVKKQLKDAYARDPLRFNISGHINFCLKRANLSKAGVRFEKLLGYGIDDLRRHLERQFTGAMSWDNRGKLWEVDHIIPLASFKITSPTDSEFAAAWALTNLRPLLKSENRSKGGRRLTLL